MSWETYLTTLQSGLNSIGLSEASDLFNLNIIPETIQNNQYCIIPGIVKISDNQELGQILGMMRKFKVNIYHDYFNMNDLSELNGFVEKAIKYIEIDFESGYEYNGVSSVEYSTILESRKAIASIIIKTEYHLEV